MHLWITSTENLNWIKASHVFQPSREINKLRENVNKIHIKSGSGKEELFFVEFQQISSQVADKNVNTDFQWNLSMNLLETNMEALKFRFSGWWFDAAGVDNFLQYGSFRFKFGRQ